MFILCLSYLKHGVGLDLQTYQDILICLSYTYEVICQFYVFDASVDLNYLNIVSILVFVNCVTKNKVKFYILSLLHSRSRDLYFYSHLINN